MEKDALAYEIIPVSRLNLKYLIIRSSRMGVGRAVITKKKSFICGLLLFTSSFIKIFLYLVLFLTRFFWAGYVR